MFSNLTCQRVSADDVYLTNKIEYYVNIYNYVHIFSLHALQDSIIIMCNNIRNKIYIIQF